MEIPEPKTRQEALALRSLGILQTFKQAAALPVGSRFTDKDGDLWERVDSSHGELFYIGRPEGPHNQRGSANAHWNSDDHASSFPMFSPYSVYHLPERPTHCSTCGHEVAPLPYDEYAFVCTNQACPA